MPAWITASDSGCFRRDFRFRLAFFWFLGFAGGLFCYGSSDVSYFSLMRSYSFGTVSIVRMLMLSLFPYFLTAIAVLFSASWLLYFLCFGRAFVFCCVSFCFLCAFGSAGWLIWFLALLSDLAGLPILYFFWLKFLSGAMRRKCFSSFFLMGIGTLLCSLEYYIVLPFLASLLSKVS